jgi:5-methylcytosine-specific restriction enzyme subunit McrC
MNETSKTLLADNQNTSTEVNTTQRRKVFTAVEYEAVPIPLSDLIINGEMSIYPKIAEGDFLRVYASRDKLVFQTGGYMGLIPINDRVVLDVKPRVPVRNLERMLLKTQHSPKALNFYQREYSHHEEIIPSLIDVLTDALIAGLEQISVNGIHREYIYVEQDTSFPKGRILIGQTIKQHLLKGRNHSISAAWYAPSIDIPVNQCLKYVIWYLSEKYRLMIQKKGWMAKSYKLNDFYRMFDRVTLDRSRSFLNDKYVKDPVLLPSLRSYYDPVIRIAKTIIDDQGISLEETGDDVVLPSLVMKLEDIFERYVLEVLKERGRNYEPDLEVLDGNLMPPNGGAKLLFDAPPSEKATPDIVFKYNGVDKPTFPVIIDAKYKPTNKPARDDLNQIITYGCSYKCPTVLLVYPSRGKEIGLKFEGQIDQMKVYTYWMNLASQNPDQEEDKIFDAMLSLIPNIEKPDNE